MQNFNAVGRFRRLKETKMWQNRVLGLDPGLNAPEFIHTQTLTGHTLQHSLQYIENEKLRTILI